MTKYGSTRSKIVRGMVAGYHEARDNAAFVCWLGIAFAVFTVMVVSAVAYKETRGMLQERQWGHNQWEHRYVKE